MNNDEKTSGKFYTGPGHGAAAGSLRPEIAAADYIAAQMESIGLEVEKVPVTVDKWQFNDASLTMEGTDISIMPASYAASSSRWPRPQPPRPRPCRLWQNSWPHKVCSLQFAPAALYCG